MASCEIEDNTTVLKDPRAVDAVERYLSGESAANVGSALGVNGSTVIDWLRKAGFETRSRSEARSSYYRRSGDHPRLRKDVSDELIAKRYGLGEPIPHIAEQLGVSSELVRGRLNRLGIQKRSPTEAWSRIRREKHMARVAKSRSRNVGFGEKELCGWLIERGESPQTQFPVGSKNLDLAIHPIAVEVHFCTNSPIHFPRYRKRIKYLADRGWSSCYVMIARRTKVLIPDVADKIVSILKFTRSNPSAMREHWVIRGCGEIAAVVGDDLNHGPLIRPSPSCPYHRSRN